MNRWKMAPRCLAAAFASALAAGSAGCNQVECGLGTLETDGVCLPADDQPGNAQCGAGTKLGDDGKCAGNIACDPLTTREEIDPDTGQVTCVGISTGDTCDDDLLCEAPTSGMYTICGRLYDSQTDQPMIDPGGRIDPCPSPAPATGPCSLTLTFVDALQFAMNPATAPPLVPSTLTRDTCGRFRAVDLPSSSFGFIGIAVDDAAGTGDRYKLTGVALDQDDALPRVGFRAYATRNETDTAWTTTSAISGQSFATRGVLAAVFRHAGVSRAGVMVRRASQLIPNDDFYFSDASGTTRNTVVPAAGAQSSTGMNGTALVINSPAPEFHDGIGAEPPTCRWPNSLAASIMGVVFMQIKDSEGTGGPGAVCPP